MVKFKKISTKLIVLAVVVALVPLIISSGSSLSTLQGSMATQTHEALVSDTNLAESVMAIKMDSLSSLNDYTSKTYGMINSIENRDIDDLNSRIKILNQGSDIDLMAITDKNGKIISSNINKDVDVSNILNQLIPSGTNHGLLKLSSSFMSNFPKSKIDGVSEGIGLVAIDQVSKDGQVIGYLVMVKIVNNDVGIVDEIKSITGNEVTVFMDNVRISTSISNGGTRFVGTKSSDEVYLETKAGNTYDGEAHINDEDYITIYEPLHDVNGNYIGMLFVGTPKSTYTSLMNQLMTQSVIVSLLGLLISVALAFFISKSISKPMALLKEGAEKFSQGDYSHRVVVNTHDETHDLAESFNEMADNVVELNKTLDMDKAKLAELLREISDVMNRVAEGDLTARMIEHEDNKGLDKAINSGVISTGDLISELKEQLSILDNEVHNIRKELEDAKETSEQVSEAASQVATASSDQSIKLQDATDQLEITNQLTKDLYTNAEDTVQLNNEIEDNSQIGVQKVENAVVTMQKITNVIDNLGKSIEELGEESKKINEVTTLIKDIAEQTGLLALNASIEAARAGEAGKGFAVVASEIKSLAEEIQKSVEDINKTIVGMNSKVTTTIKLGTTGREEVDKGVIAIDEVNDAFMKIKESVNKATIAINTIKEDSKKASTSTDDALRNAQDIASISEEFTATAEEVTASTEELDRVISEIEAISKQVVQVAERVEQSAGRFKIE
ncbi:methyl-accepting chemotaxis protein [Methanococcus voltae]|uniref:Methyl-accepting chemotaxis protein n=1 Tax=Methanococcus voltae PS TaxID=523842 RepID=A0ABT2EXC8_METVO|nr:methyl-accepting chemotaxis protein [Methanococcus voltae]MBP2172795.1 methyl-accepting chemotaxis protein [Methanococcus voltae]MCS3922619.1 methyl-accepting chemotaxis protein [Methanococcus voltae PS]